MDDLLPCPFCGSPAEYDSQRAERIPGFHTSTGHAVYCSSMECECSIGIHSTPEEAIAAWNRRVMMSFNRSEYERIFDIGKRIYGTAHPQETRELGVELMFMAESVIGQIRPWPNLSKHYRTFLSELERRTP